MKEKLNAYMSGKANYTPQMNIFLNYRGKEDPYVTIGKYIYNSFDIRKSPDLSFMYESIQAELSKGLLSKVKDKITNLRSPFARLSIWFLTSTLDYKVLKEMFGEPLYHSEFGEGLKGTGSRKRADFASYFVNVGGLDIHVGFDTRGTSLELGGKIRFGSDGVKISEEQYNKSIDAVKELVDLYAEKVINK